MTHLSPENAEVRQLLGAFYKTVDVMKSARNSQSKTMNIWPEDMKAVEDVMLFLEKLRDGIRAQQTRKPGFAFPEIVIAWTEINAQQFANSRAALMAKLTRFMSPENKETAYWSDNHFNRSEMYVLHELLKAASALTSPGCKS